MKSAAAAGTLGRIRDWVEFEFGSIYFPLIQPARTNLGLGQNLVAKYRGMDLIVKLGEILVYNYSKISLIMLHSYILSDYIL